MFFSEALFNRSLYIRNVLVINDLFSGLLVLLTGMCYKTKLYNKQTICNPGGIRSDVEA